MMLYLYLCLSPIFQMKKCGWSASISTFTSLFNACANSPWREDGLQRALKLKEQINNQGVILNSKVYHAMIKGTVCAVQLRKLTDVTEFIFFF
jgi:pentatricopeptide repeat domain-containing protein 1